MNVLGFTTTSPWLHLALTVEGQLLSEEEVLRNQRGAQAKGDSTGPEDFHENGRSSGDQVKEGKGSFVIHGRPILHVRQPGICRHQGRLGAKHIKEGGSSNLQVLHAITALDEVSAHHRSKQIGF